jgi:NAD(P) transhydrogenase subunit alpha
VTLVGETNLPALVAADASSLYARNVLDFLKLVLTKEGEFKVDMEDDIVAACLMTQGGDVKRKSALTFQPYLKKPEISMEAVSPTLLNLIIFVLAIYVGYHVVWTVTPALHTPLMAVTNAISAIVIVGAMLAAALTETTLGKTMGVLAVALAAVNVFGGFLVTRRMLEMFKKKEKKAVTSEGDKA